MKALLSAMVLLPLLFITSGCCGDDGEEPCVVAEDDTGEGTGDDSGAVEEEIAVVGVVFTLVEIPSWDTLLIAASEQQGWDICFQFSSGGVLDVWMHTEGESSISHYDDDDGGEWGRTDTTNLYEVEWINFNAEYSDSNARQGWRWLDAGTVATDGAAYDADVILVEAGCPFAVTED